jgi:repressor of nif and glnA expression
MDFDPETGEGSVILNVSLVPEEKADKALQLMALTLCSPYILSERIVTAGGGEAIGDVSVPHGSVGIGTVCSLSFNGIFMHAGIPVFPRMGGVVKIEGNRAVGFHDFISYECSSVAPLEIIIKSGLTEVRKAIFMGSGNILGSFREIPAGRFQEAKDLLKKLSAHGIKDTILFGEPGKALLDIPVPDGRIGIIVPGGTNAHAALHEAGLSTSLQAIATLYPYQELRAAAICAEQGAVLPLQDPSDLK